MEVHTIGRTAIWCTRWAYRAQAWSTRCTTCCNWGRPRRHDIASKRAQWRWRIRHHRRGRGAGTGPDWRERHARSRLEEISREAIRRLLNRSASNRGADLIWCRGRLNEQYRRRKYDLLALYTRARQHDSPAAFVDEQSTPLLFHDPPPVPVRSGMSGARGYEYVQHPVGFMREDSDHNLMPHSVSVHMPSAPTTSLSELAPIGGAESPTRLPLDARTS